MGSMGNEKGISWNELFGSFVIYDKYSNSVTKYRDIRKALLERVLE